MKILCLVLYLVGGWRLLLLLLAAMIVAIAQHHLPHTAATSAPTSTEGGVPTGAPRPPVLRTRITP
jgi:hypothetical protein